MEEFEFTYKGFLALLKKDGRNTKGKLRKRLETAKIDDLERLKRSIQEEIRNRRKRGVE